MCTSLLLVRFFALVRAHLATAFTELVLTLDPAASQKQLLATLGRHLMMMMIAVSAERRRFMYLMRLDNRAACLSEYMS